MPELEGLGRPLLPSTVKVLFQTADRLYLPAPLLSIGLLIHIWIGSLTPVSNEPPRFHLKDLCIVKLYAVVRLVIIYVFIDYWISWARSSMLHEPSFQRPPQLKLLYWFMCVSFLNNLVLIGPSEGMTNQVSRKVRVLSVLSKTIFSSVFSVTTLCLCHPLNGCVHHVEIISELLSWAFFVIMYVIHVASP